MKTIIFLLALFVLVLLGTPGIVHAKSTTTSGTTPWRIVRYKNIVFCVTAI
jgi:hypothetical protein